MTPDAQKELRALRTRADANIRERDVAQTIAERGHLHRDQAMVEIDGEKYAVELFRLQLDKAKGWTCYLAFIGRAGDTQRNAPKEISAAILNAIWIGEWSALGIRHRAIPGVGLFMRVRKSIVECPHCDHVNQRTTDNQQMMCSKCFKNFQI